MVFALLLLFCLVFPNPIQAQEIPISYQLMMAFRPTTIIRSIASISPVPTSSTPSPSVLGTTTQSPSIATTLPAIGGEGKMVNIAVLGDSMIETLGHGIPSLVKALQLTNPNNKYNILNYGYGASNIEQAINRLTIDYNYNGKFFPNLISQNPDIIVIESFAYNNFGNTQSGYDRQWMALANITGTIKNKLPQSHIIIAATIAPNSVTFANGAFSTHFSALEKIEKTNTIKLYLENAIKFAAGEKYPIIDAYHPSLTSNNGNPNFINSTDHIHPSVAGAQLFSTLAAKIISTID